MTTSTNPFAYRKPITLDTLGDLFSHHRGLTGGFNMGPDDEPPTPEPTPTPAPTPEPEFAPITSQADLDKVLGQRLAREREKFADYAELQRKAAEHDAAVEAAKTDAEKAVEKARQEGLNEGRSAANDRLVKAETRALAAELKFRNPALAVATVDLSGVKVNDDGSVDAAAIKTALTALATSDPYLVDDGKKPGPRPDLSQGGGGGVDVPSVSRGREMYEQARAARKTTGKAPSSL